MMPSRYSSGLVRMSKAAAEAPGTQDARRRLLQGYHRLVHAAAVALQSVPDFILVCIIVAMCVGCRCVRAVPECYCEAFGPCTSAVAAPRNDVAGSGVGCIATARQTQQQDMTLSAAGGLQYMLNGFISVCVVLTAGYQCCGSVSRDVYSDASSLYTPAVGVVPLLWCLHNKYSSGCSDDRAFRKSCAPTQQF